MKRLTQRQKLFQLRRRDRIERRRRNRLRDVTATENIDLLNADGAERLRFRRRHQIRIPVPRIFSLEYNYDEVMEFITELREDAVRDRYPLHLDFTTLGAIGPAGALLLAAEIDPYRPKGVEQFNRLPTFGKFVGFERNETQSVNLETVKSRLVRDLNDFE